MGKRSNGFKQAETAVAEQWNGPAYISDGQGKALGEEIAAQQVDYLRQEFQEGLQMMQSNWEQRQSQQDGWYTHEQWDEHMRSQWEDRQWDGNKWSKRDDPQWDEQSRSTHQTRHEWSGWK